MKGSNDRSAKGQQMILDALKDSFWGIRTEAIGKVAKLKDEKRTEGIAKLKDLAANDPVSAVRSAALAKLGKMLEPEEVESFYIASVANDSSYAVITTALSTLGKDNPEKAMELAGPLEAEKSSSMLSGVGQLYAGFAGPEKFEFFEDAFNGTVIQGFDKLGLMSSFTYFISRHDAATMERALPIYNELSEGGGMYMAMFLPQNLDYIIKSIDEKIKDLNAELVEFEKNNDALYAAQTRKKIEEFEKVSEKVKKKIEELESEE
jgi:aminopeptidase N